MTFDTQYTIFGIPIILILLGIIFYIYYINSQKLTTHNNVQITTYTPLDVVSVNADKPFDQLIIPSFVIDKTYIGDTITDLNGKDVLTGTDEFSINQLKSIKSISIQFGKLTNNQIPITFNNNSNIQTINETPQVISNNTVKFGPNELKLDNGYLYQQIDTNILMRFKKLS